jgi:hypothetical protein
MILDMTTSEKPMGICVSTLPPRLLNQTGVGLSDLAKHHVGMGFSGTFALQPLEEGV